MSKYMLEVKYLEKESNVSYWFNSFADAVAKAIELSKQKDGVCTVGIWENVDLMGIAYNGQIYTWQVEKQPSLLSEAFNGTSSKS